MINKKRDSVIAFLMHHHLLPLLHEFMVKLDEQEHLVLDIREEIVLADEIEHVWTAESQEEREGFAWLAVGSVPCLFVCLFVFEDEGTSENRYR
jgi:hypothetical protein